jgi:hypothetical protein
MTFEYVIIGAIITILFVSPIIEMVEASSSKEDKMNLQKNRKRSGISIKVIGQR